MNIWHSLNNFDTAILYLSPLKSYFNWFNGIVVRSGRSFPLLAYFNGISHLERWFQGKILLIFAWVTFRRASKRTSRRERERLSPKTLRTTLETAANVVIMTAPIRKSNQIKSRSNLEMWIHLANAFSSFHFSSPSLSPLAIINSMTEQIRIVRIRKEVFKWNETKLSFRSEQVRANSERNYLWIRCFSSFFVCIIYLWQFSISCFHTYFFMHSPFVRSLDCRSSRWK